MKGRNINPSSYLISSLAYYYDQGSSNRKFCCNIPVSFMNWGPCSTNYDIIVISPIWPTETYITSHIIVIALLGDSQKKLTAEANLAMLLKVCSQILNVFTHIVLNVLPSFFIHDIIVPVSIVGERLGIPTTLCSGRSSEIMIYQHNQII